MSINVPKDLKYITGIDVSSDEDGLVALAGVWRDLAQGMAALAARLRAAVNVANANYAGRGQSKFAAAIGPFVEVMPNTEELFGEIADALEQYSFQVERMKIMAITTLAELAAELAWALANIPVTFGASFIQWLAKAAATRVLWRAFVLKVLVWLLENVIKAAVWQVALQLLMDMAVQFAMLIRHPGKYKWDVDSTVQAVYGGLMGAAIALPVGLVMQKLIAPILFKAMRFTFGALARAGGQLLSTAFVQRLGAVAADVAQQFEGDVGRVPAPDLAKQMSKTAMQKLAPHLGEHGWAHFIEETISEVLTEGLVEVIVPIPLAAAQGQPVSASLTDFTSGAFSGVFEPGGKATRMAWAQIHTPNLHLELGELGELTEPLLSHENSLAELDSLTDSSLYSIPSASTSTASLTTPPPYTPSTPSTSTNSPDTTVSADPPLYSMPTASASTVSLVPPPYFSTTTSTPSPASPLSRLPSFSSSTFSATSPSPTLLSSTSTLTSSLFESVDTPPPSHIPESDVSAITAAASTTGSATPSFASSSVSPPSVVADVPMVGPTTPDGPVLTLTIDEAGETRFVLPDGRSMDIDELVPELAWLGPGTVQVRGAGGQRRVAHYARQLARQSGQPIIGPVRQTGSGDWQPMIFTPDGGRPTPIPAMTPEPTPATVAATPATPDLAVTDLSPEPTPVTHMVMVEPEPDRGVPRRARDPLNTGNAFNNVDSSRTATTRGRTTITGQSGAAQSTMSVGSCLDLLRELRDTLYPGGVRARQVRDDIGLGTRRGGEEFGSDAGWPRLGSWPELVDAVTAAGPGSAGFVLLRRPNGVGHAFALVNKGEGKLADGSGGPQRAGLYWVELGGPLRRQWISQSDMPVWRESASSVRALVVRSTSETDRFGAIGQVVARPFAPVIESDSTARVIVDPPRDPRYGKIGLELEFYSIEVLIDGERAGRGPRLEVRVSDGAARLENDGVRGFTPEIVTQPMAMLPGEAGLDSVQTLDVVDATISRLREVTEDGTPVDDLFSEPAGYSVTAPGSGHNVTLRRLPGDWMGAHVHFSVGVPLPGLYEVLRLVAEQQPAPASFRNAAALAHLREGLDFGVMMARALLPTGSQGGVRGREAAAMAGYLALVYTHAAAQAYWPLTNDFVKGHVLTLSRYNLDIVRKGLPDKVTQILDRDADLIRSRFTSFFTARNQELVDGFRSESTDGYTRQLLDIDVTEPVLLPRDYTIGDLIDTALRVESPQVSQTSAFGKVMTLHKLDVHNGVPLAVIEIRRFVSHYVTDGAKLRDMYNRIESKVREVYDRIVAGDEWPADQFTLLTEPRPIPWRSSDVLPVVERARFLRGFDLNSGGSVTAPPVVKSDSSRGGALPVELPRLMHTFVSSNEPIRWLSDLANAASSANFHLVMWTNWPRTNPSTMAPSTKRTRTVLLDWAARSAVTVVSINEVFDDSTPMQLLGSAFGYENSRTDSQYGAQPDGQLRRLAGAEILHRFGGVFVESDVDVEDWGALATLQLGPTGIAFGCGDGLTEEGEVSARVIAASAGSDGSRAWLAHLAGHHGVPHLPVDLLDKVHQSRGKMLGWQVDMVVRLGDYPAAWDRLARDLINSGATRTHLPTLPAGLFTISDSPRPNLPRGLVGGIGTLDGVSPEFGPNSTQLVRELLGMASFEPVTTADYDIVRALAKAAGRPVTSVTREDLLALAERINLTQGDETAILSRLRDLAVRTYGDNTSFTVDDLVNTRDRSAAAGVGNLAATEPQQTSSVDTTRVTTAQTPAAAEPNERSEERLVANRRLVADFGFRSDYVATDHDIEALRILDGIAGRRGAPASRSELSALAKDLNVLRWASTLGLFSGTGRRLLNLARVAQQVYETQLALGVRLRASDLAAVRDAIELVKHKPAAFGLSSRGSYTTADLVAGLRALARAVGATAGEATDVDVRHLMTVIRRVKQTGPPSLSRLRAYYDGMRAFEARSEAAWLQAALSASARPEREVDATSPVPDLFGLLTPPSQPEYLQGLDLSALRADQMAAFFDAISMTNAAPTNRLEADALPHDDRRVSRPHSRDPSDRRWGEWAPWDQVDEPPELDPLPERMEFPHLAHFIWLGSELTQPDFRANITSATRQLDGAVTVVVWTDIPRHVFAQAEAESTAVSETDTLANVRAMLKWAREAGVALVNVDEVFSAATPMTLDPYYRLEMLRQTGPGYAGASDILRGEIVLRFGGLYLDVDDRFRDHSRHYAGTNHSLRDRLIDDVEYILNRNAQDPEAGQGFAVHRIRHSLANDVLMAVPGHPFVKILLDEIHRRYTLTQRELFETERETFDVSDLDALPPDWWVRHDSTAVRMSRDECMLRSGPSALVEAASRAGLKQQSHHRLPSVRSVTTGTAHSWAAEPTAHSAPLSRDETLLVTQKIITTLISDFYPDPMKGNRSDRNGDLYLTSVEQVVSKQPDPGAIWIAVLRFIAERPELAIHVRTVTDLRIVRERDPVSGVETIVRKPVSLPPEAFDLIDFLDDPVRSDRPATLGWWLSERQRAARLTIPPTRTPGNDPRRFSGRTRRR